MKIQRCKGMRDLSPADMTAFRHVEGICRDNFLKWGYQEVRTPIIEYLHLFTSAGTLTPGMLGKVYSFLDWDGWSGERVVLRPDGTIPVARLYTESVQKGLARLCYTANTFRFEEAKEKSRERWQCGAELIGAGSAAAEAELVLLSLEILNKLGLKNIELRLSHAGIIKALLEKLGLSAEEQHKMLDRILDGEAEALAKISGKSPDAASILKPLLSLNGQSTGFLQNQKGILTRSMPEIRTPLEDFLKTVVLLDDLGIKYKINIASGAGFEYYTGLIFQLFVGKEKVGGGGRYDALIPAMGGSNVPAAGFALYVERLMAIINPETIATASTEKVIVRPIMEDAIKEAFKTADNLRKAGFIAEIDLDGQKTGTEWIIEVGDKGVGFKVLDNKKYLKYNTETFSDVIRYLEGRGGDKNSPA
jgi:histidyl-tRNA synthetase